MKYRILYSNMGRPERTTDIDTLAEAQESADFLKFQGAKRVRIERVPDNIEEVRQCREMGRFVKVNQS
jgi:hypothetical protein